MTISRRTEYKFCFAVIILSLLVSAGIKLTDFTNARSEKTKLKKPSKNQEINRKINWQEPDW